MFEHAQATFHKVSDRVFHPHHDHNAQPVAGNDVAVNIDPVLTSGSASTSGQTFSETGQTYRTTATDEVDGNLDDVASEGFSVGKGKGISLEADGQSSEDDEKEYGTFGSSEGLARDAPYRPDTKSLQQILTQNKRPKTPAGGQSDSAYNYVVKTRSFFIAGRVFKVFEPAASEQPITTSRPPSIDSDVTWDEVADQAVRTFVVVNACAGWSECAPIHTYGPDATLESGLLNPNHHAMIHDSHTECPQVRDRTDLDECGHISYRREVLLDPFRVERECEEPLNSLSRINFGKAHIIPHGWKYFNIGYVEENLVPRLQRHLREYRQSTRNWSKPSGS